MSVNCARAFPEWESIIMADQILTSFVMPQIISISPTDGALYQGIGTTRIEIKFTKVMNADTITTNTENTNCTGSL